MKDPTESIMNHTLGLMEELFGKTAKAVPFKLEGEHDKKLMEACEQHKECECKRCEK